jgi:hypothetical protein
VFLLSFLVLDLSDIKNPICVMSFKVATVNVDVTEVNFDCSSFVMCPLQVLPLPRAFLQQPQTVPTRQVVRAINQSILLRYLRCGHFRKNLNTMKKAICGESD